MEFVLLSRRAVEVANYHYYRNVVLGGIYLLCAPDVH
jgi:hypothetical protein